MSTGNPKVFIVTGALGSIGGVTARLLAEKGWRVVVTDIVSEGGTALADSLSASGGDASFIAADLAEEAQVKALVEHTLDRFGRLDGAFNNAGVEQHGKPIVELTSDEWARVMRINAQGMFHCVKHQMRVLGRGASIVNTSSALGQFAVPHAAEYIASKHAVCGLTRAAAIEGAANGIRVNAVLPGVVRTPMHERSYSAPEMAEPLEMMRRAHPIGRFAEPEEIGHLVRWLLSDEASFVTGALYSIDGGATAV